MNISLNYSIIAYQNMQYAIYVKVSFK